MIEAPDWTPAVEQLSRDYVANTSDVSTSTSLLASALRKIDADALLRAPEPPRRDIEQYAMAAHSTLEKELVRALGAERKRVQEAVALGQKLAEAQRDHAVAVFDELLASGDSSELRARFVAALGAAK